MSVIPSVYLSTDPGAPVLTGQVGSLAALLDAVLVDGYGTGPTAKSPAGWTRAFTATNKRAFRNSAVTGTGGYLRVDDSSAVGGSNARHALARAYKTMSDVDTGTDPGPTTAQLANGVILVKSTTLDSTARAWCIVASEKFAYFFVNAPATTISGLTGVPYFPAFFGDFVSLKPGDAYNFAVISNQLTSFTGSNTTVNSLFYGGNALSGSSVGQGGWTLRSHSAASGAAPISGILSVTGAAWRGGNVEASYPHPVTGGLLIERILLKEAGAHVLRGYLPNVYSPLHHRPFANGDVKTDVQDLPVGTELYVKDYSGSNVNPSTSDIGQVFFDVINAW